MRRKHFFYLTALFCQLCFGSYLLADNITKAPIRGVLRLNPEANKLKSLAVAEQGIWSLHPSGIFVGSYDKDWVAGYDLKSKRFSWFYSTGSSSLSTTPTMIGDDVVVSLRSGRIAVLSVQTGSLKWEQRIPTYVDRPITLIQDLLIVQTADQKVFAYDALTGRSRWMFESPIKPSLSVKGGAMAMGAGEHIIVGDDSGYIYTLQKSDGKPIWRFAPESKGQRFQGFIQTLGFNGQALLAARADGFLGAFVPKDNDTAEVLWQYQNLNNPTQVVAKEGRLFAASLSSGVAVLSAENGKELWLTKLDHNVIALLVSNKFVYGLSGDCHLSAMDIDTGIKKWSYDMNGYCSGDMFLYQSRLFVPTGYKNIYIFGEEKVGEVN